MRVVWSSPIKHPAIFAASEQAFVSVNNRDPKHCVQSWRAAGRRRRALVPEALASKAAS
jgi:hypothetical protein